VILFDVRPLLFECFLHLKEDARTVEIPIGSKFNDIKEQYISLLNSSKNDADLADLSYVRFVFFFCFVCVCVCVCVCLYVFVLRVCVCVLSCVCVCVCLE